MVSSTQLAIFICPLKYRSRLLALDSAVVRNVFLGLLFIGTTTSVLADAIFDSTDWGGSIRARVESVDDSLNERGTAWTLRGTTHFKGTNEKGFGFFAELEGVYGFGEYSDGGSNKNTTHATIADPDGLELNRFYVSFSPLDGDSNTSMKIGRFNCNHDDGIIDRYLSNIGWRQNHRTYDGANLESQWGKSKLRTSYIFNVNRVFGEGNPNPVRANFDVNGIGIQADHAYSQEVNLEAYLYHFVFEDLPRFSTRTVGGKVFGESPLSENLNIVYKLDIATQEGVDENPNRARFSYIATTIGIRVPEFFNSKFAFNTETFESNGQEAFITPLGSGHAFFGWADKFLTQPQTGIRDFFLTWDMNVRELGIKFRWHSLASDAGAIDYGSEFDWSVSGKLRENLSWTVKGAIYEGDNNAANRSDLRRDTSKFWAWVSTTF